MRNSYLSSDDTDLEDASWAFNDINLTMIIIIMFFAMIFAVLMGEAQSIAESIEDQEISELQKQKPAELSSQDYYGDTGFPKAETIKGFPVKDTFNENLVVTESKTIRAGLSGNVTWDFENMDDIREKKYMRIYVNSNGEMRYEGQVMDIPGLQREVDALHKKHNVFIELYISPNVSVGVYEQIRNYLWNESNALHWRFITQE